MGHRPVNELDVEALPRRVAHVVHAVMEIRNDPHFGPYGPFKPSEIVFYDGEALNASSMSHALVRALELGLVDRWGHGLWSATRLALDHRAAFEDRYLRETES